ncbi:hypothetical protein ACQUY5_28025 [Bacillus cereus]|uniref:hypothetical protein n=1 Tax=Bacillus cereus TaxID=1396 RepID=UPI003D17CDA9
MGVGDLVRVPRSQKTYFFEVIGFKDEKLVLTNGWVEVNYLPNEVILICSKENRKDIVND